MNPGLFTGEQIKALRENPFTDFVSVTTIRFTVEFKEMFVAAMDSGKTIRNIFRDSGCSWQRTHEEFCPQSA